MNAQFIKHRLRRLLGQAGLSEAALSKLALLLHPSRWQHHRDVETDYRELKAALSGGLSPLAPSKGAPVTLVLSLFDEFYFMKIDAVLARSLMLAGHDVTVVVSAQSLYVQRYMRLFGITKFVVLEDYVRKVGATGRYGVDACTAVQPPYSFQQLMGLRAGHFRVGEHVLSTLLGHFRVGHLDLSAQKCSTFVDGKLAVLPGLMGAVRRIFEETRPTNFLLQERGYLPNALFWDEAIERGVNFVQWCAAQETNALVLKKYSRANLKHHPLSLSTSSWQIIQGKVWTDALDHELMDMFRQRYEKDDWYNRNLFRAQAPLLTPDEVRRALNLDMSKRTAVVFSHILWDATFFYGDNLFQDYEQWLLATIRAASDNPHLNWLIKLHPDYVWKLARAGAKLDEPDILERQFGRLPPHVQLLLPDAAVNTYSLFQVTDYCITVRGTAGLEMSCFGRPVLTAGTGRYSGLGFTIDSQSQGEYLDRLAHLHTVAPLTRDQTILARKFAYALYRLRPFRHTSFTSSIYDVNQPQHPLFMNYKYSVHSDADIASAHDLNAFVDWFSDVARQDFLRPWPETTDAMETSYLRLPWTL